VHLGINDHHPTPRIEHTLHHVAEAAAQHLSEFVERDGLGVCP
jgi:hypothetical protein